MDTTTIRRHLLAAVYTLGADVGTLEQRLRKVYEGDLADILRYAGLLDHVRRDYETLMADLFDLLELQLKLDVKRASLLAKRVVLLYQQVATEL